MSESACEPRGPLTYVISYTEGNTVSDAWLEQMRAAPPDILHHGHDVPLNNLWGPTNGFSMWEPDHEGGIAEVRAKMDLLRTGIDRLHEAGVRHVIPYMNPSIIGGMNGSSEGADGSSAGFLHFWRRRRDFAALGLDTLPDEDPMDWMQRNWFSFGPYNSTTAMRRFEPCLRREPWLRYLETVAGLIAEAGYDGVFSDDNLVQCYCPQCMRDFRAFLREEFGTRLAEMTGGRPLEQVMLCSDDGRGEGPAMRRPTTGKLSEGPAPGDASPESRRRLLLWQASQAFWSQTIGDMLGRLAEAGRRHNPSFFVVANWGASQTTREFAVRRRLGHDFRRWRTGAVWQMLEEEGNLGFLAQGLAAEMWPALRAAHAHGVEPALLMYHGGDPMQAALGHAEVASACCGAYVGHGGETAPRSLYSSYFRERAELFGNVRPWGPVGLLYSLDEIARNNDTHLRLFYAAARALGRCHVPYDVVTEASIDPAVHRLVIVPGIAASDRRISGVPALALGPGEAEAAHLVSREEIDLDFLLDAPREARGDKLAALASARLTFPAPLVGRIESALGEGVALTAPGAAPDVRLRAYVARDRRRLVVHVVNYGCTSGAQATPAPGPAAPFRMLLPTLDGQAAREAWTCGPEAPEEPLSVVDAGGSRVTDVPSTLVYRAVIGDY